MSRGTRPLWSGRAAATAKGANTLLLKLLHTTIKHKKRQWHVKILSSEASSFVSEYARALKPLHKLPNTHAHSTKRTL